MSKKTRYKYILFLVEGKSDAEALEPMGAFFDNIDDQYDVRFIIFDEAGNGGGDITCEPGITPETIAGCICKSFIDDYLEKERIYARAIERIIHIVDLDGTFINGGIVEGKSPNGKVKTYYENTRIITENPQGIVDRNDRKSKNIQKLVSLTYLYVRQKGDNPNSKKRAIPYSVFFFSSNLDHFLHNEPNLGDEDPREKRFLAKQFASGFDDDLSGFIEFFTKDCDATTGMTFDESWEFAKKEFHSLERHTNLNLLFEEYQ